MKRQLVLHPFLFAIFPVLFLFAHNLEQFRTSMIVGPMVVTTCIALVSWCLLSFILRDKSKSGFIVSLFLFLFFSYGICYLEMRTFMAGLGGRYVIGTSLHVLVIWAIIFALGVYAVVKTHRSLHNPTNVANIVAGALVLMQLINVGSHALKTRSVGRGSVAVRAIEMEPADVSDSSMLPDIYYIILDGYARADVLEEIYQYDNAEFLGYLSAEGFYVAHESRSNYCQTVLSLASSLNLMYLDSLVDEIGVEYVGRGQVTDMVRNSIVADFLRRHGYEIVAFASGYHRTEMRSADRYLAARWYPNEFQVALLNMTPLPLLMRSPYDMHHWHRERILYTLDHLADLSELEGPVFVFAHVIAPHPPFVLGRNGEAIDPEHQFMLSDGNHLIGRWGFTRDEYVSRYRDQLIFINSRVKAAVDGILSRSPRPPIIILQADHGPGSMLDWEDPDSTYFKERLSVLNAYYLPDDGEACLYDEITPVNTFRVIFNCYLGTDYELLEDESYFSTVHRPYAFINVTADVKANTARHASQ